MTRLMTRLGPHEDERIEGRNTLHDKTYIFEREDPSHEDKPKPSPRVVDLEPGTDDPSIFPSKLNKDAEIDISGPNPDDPPVGTVLAKIHARLRDKAELLKLHLKHYHMKTKNFKRRTSALKIPEDIYIGFSMRSLANARLVRSMCRRQKGRVLQACALQKLDIFGS